MSPRASALPRLGGRRFIWPVRVYYEDTDASGVVYHGSYLRYFERARTEWLRTLGLMQQDLRGRFGVVFTVADLDIRFRQPARLDDELEVVVAIPHVRYASLTFEQELRRRGGSDVLSTARVRVGCVDVEGFRPCPLPEDFMNAMRQWSE